MANKSLFKSLPGNLVPATNAVNEEAAPAYALEPRHALAQYAATGCLNATFYASAEEQLEKVLALCARVEPAFIAKTAVYCRERGFMKDLPALLCAVLSTRDIGALRQVFDRVIDDGRMARNFTQILRSGAVGRKSLGTAPKKLILRWLARRTGEQLFRASVGEKPSLADVIKMVHPKPADAERQALYGYLLGRPHDPARLPDAVKQFEAFKGGARETIPDAPFQLLTALALGSAEWSAIARNASWQMTRMNLNTFARHGVFQDAALTRLVADRLRDPVQVKRARAFPYQLLMAFKAADGAVPEPVRDALQDAMEIAIQNVPAIPGKVYLCPDVSGSMQAPATGFRAGSSSSARCVDVAALISAALLRKNPQAEVLPFESDVVAVRLNARDSVMTNAQKLASIVGGGTNCSAPLALLNRRKANGDLVVFISDNESWMDAPTGRGTATMRAWAQFQNRNPQARLVCLDIQPYATTQARERKNILNIGGFSDAVFNLMAAFAAGNLDARHWVGVIQAISL
jgi:60 kDa SS-A/Ro ribonucleoprotein